MAEAIDARSAVAHRPARHRDCARLVSCYRDSQRAAGDDGPKKDKVFTVEADKIDEIAIKSEAGERTTLQKTGTGVADRGAGGRASRTPPRSRASPPTCSSLEIQRVVDENPPDLKEFGLGAAADRSRLQVRRPGAHAADRAEDAAGHRPLRQARRREEGLPDPVVPRLDLQRGTFDLRDKSVLKVDREKVDSLEVTAGDRTIRFAKAERRVADDAAGRRDGRTSARSKGSSPDHRPADEVDRRTPTPPTRRSTGSTSRPRPSGSAPARRRPRSCSASADEGTSTRRDLSRPIVFTVEVGAPRRPEEGPVRVPAEGSVRRARRSTPRASRSSRGGQTTRSRRPRPRTRTARRRRSGARSRRRRGTLDQAKFDALISAITGARATGFVDARGGKGAGDTRADRHLQVRRGQEGRARDVRASRRRRASRRAPASPGAATIDASTIDAIVKALEELK